MISEYFNNTANCKYRKIMKLHQLLADKKIKHNYVKCYDGMKIEIISEPNVIGDFVEHQYSYGLEGMGVGFDDVIPNCSIDRAYKIIKEWLNL